MKRLFLTLSLILCLTTINAQVEYVVNFNNYSTGEKCLDGQDYWSTHYQSAGTSPDFDVDYTIGGLLSPDESIAVFYPYGGPGVGRTATRKATDNFNFNFQDGGIIDFEFDMYPAWWGTYAGVGLDADGDGNILVGMTEGDGGVTLRVAGSGNENHPNITLPDGTDILVSNYKQENWARYKMSFDFSAFDGAGSLTVFVKDFNGTSWGEWMQLAEVTEVNMGLTPGSQDYKDNQMWDAIFFHCQGGTGGFDNFLVRQMPEGNMQYITLADIPKQLIINPPYTLEATTTSGLPVSFEIVSGPATIDGNVMTLTGEVGTVTLKATQAGDDTWLAAPDVVKTFEVIDPMAYSPEIKVRRPYDATNVYLPNLKPIILNVSLYIEHADALLFEEVKCTIDGEEVLLSTDFPNDPENGYFYAYWTPSRYGEHTMTTSITTSGGKITEAITSFNITNEYDNVDVTAFNGDLQCTPSVHSAQGEYVFPTHVGAFNEITAYYDHNCINGDCDPYDRVGGVKIRDYRGNWMELYRYTTPFGIECEDNVDVTDFTSLLQGLVEFELYFESWDGSGYQPTLSFNMVKGTPEYLYVDVEEVWFNTYAFGDYANLQPVPKVDYSFNEQTLAASLKIITSGHNWSSNTSPNYTINTGNAAEFYEATHGVKINNEHKFEQHLWRGCSPNPAECQPQPGTWYNTRSGWCPGSIVMVWDYDLSEYIKDETINIFYEFDPTYVDLCHPNHPDCVTGQNGCPNCEAPDNPVLRVSGKVLSYGNEVEVFENETSIEEIPSYNVEFFPNPAHNNVRFSSDYEDGKLSVLILNANGQEVKKFTFSGSKTVDVSDLTSGVYFVKILGNTMTTKKLVIR